MVPTRREKTMQQKKRKRTEHYPIIDILLLRKGGEFPMDSTLSSFTNESAFASRGSRFTPLAPNINCANARLRVIRLRLCSTRVTVGASGKEARGPSACRAPPDAPRMRKP